MDAAFILKKKYDAGEITGYQQAQPFLETSYIVKELLADFDFDMLNLLNRLTEIAEIPFSNLLPKVWNWLDKFIELASCPDGFSITGKSDDILSCYNAMATSLLIRMQYPALDEIQKGIDWILKYQHVERGTPNIWPGNRALKYGGCLKLTPCYIGVVKSMIALSEFKKQPYYINNEALEIKLKMGLNYILDHKLYKRQSNDKPITSDIEKITYPFSYKTNVIELLRLMKDNNLLTDPRCDDAKTFLRNKRHKEGYWQINQSYTPKCWITFDKVKQPGFWVSYEIEKVLE